MANFKQVNNAIKVKFPELDVQVMRGAGYVYFTGSHGSRVDSIMVHPTSTSTEDVIRLAIDEIENIFEQHYLGSERITE